MEESALAKKLCRTALKSAQFVFNAWQVGSSIFAENTFKSSVVSAPEAGFCWCDFRFIYRGFDELVLKIWNDSNPHQTVSVEIKAFYEPHYRGFGELFLKILNQFKFSSNFECWNHRFSEGSSSLWI